MVHVRIAARSNRMPNNPYSALKTAVYRKGRACTAYDVRQELSAYLKQFKVVAKTPEGKRIDWNDLWTRDEWHERTNGKKRRKRRKKDGSIAYDSVEKTEVTWREDDHLTSAWGREVEAFAARQRQEEDENGYNGEW